MAQLPYAVGTLAACSLATNSHQICTDCGPIRVRGHRSAASRTAIGGGAYHLAVPRAISCHR